MAGRQGIGKGRLNVGFIASMPGRGTEVREDSSDCLETAGMPGGTILKQENLPLGRHAAGGMADAGELRDLAKQIAAKID